MLKKTTIALAMHGALLAALCVAWPAAAATPPAAEAHASHAAPMTVDYALILPGNLPHVLRVAHDHADELKLDAQQRDSVRAFMAQAPARVLAHLQAAERLERALAADVLHKQARLQDVQSRLDELVRLKRAATEAQIDTLNRLQALLTPAQFAALLQQAEAAEAH